MTRQRFQKLVVKNVTNFWNQIGKYDTIRHVHQVPGTGTFRYPFRLFSNFPSLPLKNMLAESHRWKCFEGNSTRPACVSRGASASVNASLWTPPPPPPIEMMDPVAEETTTPPPTDVADQKFYIFTFGGCPATSHTINNKNPAPPTNQLTIFDLEAETFVPSLPTVQEKEEERKMLMPEKTSMWRKVKRSVKYAGLFKQAGIEHKKKLRGIETRDPLPRHSHSLLASRDGKRLWMFGGEGEQSQASSLVYRAKSSIESKRINNATFAGAKRYKGKPPVAPPGRLCHERPRVVRTYFSDLQVYCIAKNEWIDVRRQLPSKFLYGSSGQEDESTTTASTLVPWPNPRAGHSMVIMGTPMLLQSDTTSSSDETSNSDETSTKSSSAGPDPYVGLSLEEVATVNDVRDTSSKGEGECLVLWGGREGRTRDIMRGRRADPNAQELSFEDGTSVMANMLWMFDLLLLSWRQVFATGSAPPGTSYHSAVSTKDGNSMLVFGGEDELGNVIGALHLLKRSKRTKSKKKKESSESSKSKKSDGKEETKEKVVVESVADNYMYDWTWTRIQLLPTPGSPPPSTLSSMTLHPVQCDDIVLVFGGQASTSSASASFTSSSSSHSTDVAWRFNTKILQWDGTTALTNGPSQSVGGQLIGEMNTGILWHWGGGANTDNVFCATLKIETENKGASGKLECNIILNDPMSKGMLELPPIMGAISEEKQSMLLCLKSERDQHAKDLQRHCLAPSRNDWRRTKALIHSVQKSRREMLTASRSMAKIILNARPTDDSSEEEEEDEDEEKKKEKEDRVTDRAGELSPLHSSQQEPRGGSSSIRTIQTASPALGRDGSRRKSNNIMARSQTAPDLSSSPLRMKTPFISMSSSRQYFNFGVMGIKTPRWSLNTLLSPIVSIHRRAAEEEQEREEAQKREEEQSFGERVF